MKPAQLREEIKKMRFEEAYSGWCKKKLNQEQAARLLGVSVRTFRRYINRYEEEGLEGLLDRRLNRVSSRKAPEVEIKQLEDLYKRQYDGFNVRHFYRKYIEDHQGKRSYTWVKNTLQSSGLVVKGKQRGRHRKMRPRSPYPGMMLLQDGSTHEWVEGKQWDLIVTLDDATSEHYSMFFVEEEGTSSSFRGVKEVIEKHGVFSSLYTDRGSHYWNTPEAGGKVDRKNLTQFGRAMKELSIEMIPSYSPQARGRIERVFATHQDRLVKELSLHGITEFQAANRYLKEHYMPSYNREFKVAPQEDGSAFVPWVGGCLDDVLCEKYERKVGNDNCVRFEGLSLQIPVNEYRCHYVKARVVVHRYSDGKLGIFHGPRKLATYNANGELIVVGEAA
jgi:transposase